VLPVCAFWPKTLISKTYRSLEDNKMIGIIVTSVAFGAFGIVLYQHLEMAVRHRMNFGKKIIANRREAGYVVKIRYNGSKKYMYVNEMGNLSKETYWNRDDAVEACRHEFTKDRPKQTSFARAI